MLSRIAKLLDREGSMSRPLNVKVSSRYQIAVPKIARERLKIERGDRLIVDIQDGLLILIPQPEDYSAKMAGLHHEVWERLDTSAYLRQEREAWDDSTNG